MSDVENGDRDDDKNVMKWVAILAAIFLGGPILVAMLALMFPVVIVLIGEAPWLLAMFGLMTFVFLAWAGIRSGVLAKDDSDEQEEVDPLTTLQDRYAAGELSEAEFERRLESILESDEAVERAARESETPGRVTESVETPDESERRERERAGERE